jgi:hypothetical protein
MRELSIETSMETADEAMREPGMLGVPVFRDGEDPDGDPRVIDVLRVDARLLPGDAADVFAYRPSLKAVHRVRDLVHPGDLVILKREPGPFDASRFHAVRYRNRVVLTRVARKGRHVAMLPAAGSSSGFELIELDPEAPTDRDALREIVAGTVVLTLRWWGTTPRRRPST